MSKKAQATKKVETKPVAHKVGRAATKGTMGALYGVGRFAFRTGKNFVAGAAEAGREVKRGYDEAKAEAES